jgi:hypothetical protein
MKESFRESMRAQISEADGLMRVLMKPRNDKAWTEEDHEMLWASLRKARRPLLWLISVSGSVALLAAFAWWLDRRREKEDQQSQKRRDTDIHTGAIG